MALQLGLTTPNARDALRSDPDLALVVEARYRTSTASGTLSLFGQTWRGPWTAIVRTDECRDGHRAVSSDLRVAVDAACTQAEVAA